MLILFVIIGWVGVVLQAYFFMRMKRLHKKIFVNTSSASDNSDYTTALRVYQTWLDSRPENFNEYMKFSTWAKQRINAQKDAHCT